VTVSLPALDVRAIVLDIEGTTTPVDFVYKVLFPYARARAADYLVREWGNDACREAVALLREERAHEVAQDSSRPDVAHDFGPAEVAQDFSPAVAADYVASLMDQDRKSRALKMLQGLIWEQGYRGGALRGQVYPDVPPALERWNARGLCVCIYSSGSVLAQQLLFGSTAAGDLTRYLQGYFDTAVGPKTSADSYTRIAQSLGVAASHALFVSDVGAELDAASAAGLRTALCVRPGTAPPASSHPIIRDFGDVLD
jgi:enolase-phosphatase E1